ncbi:cell division protein FtsY homolog, chloroplastic isoform X5 [Typha angustifolia]|uniref:cell division protein FtsY homolog, chloroplastic isoform X5 n=1 Tax=Typha angustifolia TaxID=59011 RepID=UPI003C2C08A4
MAAAASSRLIFFHSSSPPPSKSPSAALLLRRTGGSPRFTCSAAGQTGFFTRLGRLIKEKAKSDVEKIFSGFSKTRENLAVVDELLLYWNLADTDRVLDELEEALLVSDFGPRISMKIVDSLRDDISAGKLKSGTEIKEALKRSVLELLTSKGSKTELQLGFRKPAVIMVVGVNGGGKTTSLGKLAHRLKNEGVKNITGVKNCKIIGEKPRVLTAFTNAFEREICVHTDREPRSQARSNAGTAFTQTESRVHKRVRTRNLRSHRQRAAFTSAFERGHCVHTDREPRSQARSNAGTAFTQTESRVHKCVRTRVLRSHRPRAAFTNAFERNLKNSSCRVRTHLGPFERT